MSITIPCLIGPTASGKSHLALAAAAAQDTIDIVSIDSALIYQGMDIGTAKPSRAEQSVCPHHLIDIIPPNQSFHLGDLLNHLQPVLASILNQGRQPLLVGGSMMYINALVHGVANIPAISSQTKAKADELIATASLAEALDRLDPEAIGRFHPNDHQRLRRALEVKLETGRSIVYWQQQTKPALPYSFKLIGLIPASKAILVERIATRTQAIVSDALIEEIESLKATFGLNQEHQSMQCIGYKQFWESDNQSNLEAYQAAVYQATKRLAKHQLTWLKKMPARHHLLIEDDDKTQALLDAVKACF